MKRLIYILAIVAVVVAVSGCTGDPWASNKTYSGNGLTFQYPGTWSENATKAVSTPSGSTGMIIVGSDADEQGFAVGSVSGSGLSNSALEGIMNQVKTEYKNQGYTSEKTLTVDGVQATILSNPNPNASGLYTTVAVWLKNGRIYIAAYASSDTDTATLERILSSLKTT